MAIIVIDPGHGGSASVGGSSPNNATGPTGLLEKEVTLDVSRRVRRLLLDRNHTVFMTRDSDVNLGLSDRAKVAANNNALVFLSIHFNGDDDATVQGTETWIHDTHTDDSALLAKSVQQQLVVATGLRDRGVKQKELGVLSMTVQLPSTACCLAEISFLTAPAEEDRLRTDDYKNAVADALAHGIQDYVDQHSTLTITRNVPASVADGPEKLRELTVAIVEELAKLRGSGETADGRLFFPDGIQLIHAKLTIGDAAKPVVSVELEISGRKA